jgi:hypothetical protein
MTASLKKLIHEFGIEITKNKKRSTRADDLKNLRKASDRLLETQRYLKTCGPIGRAMIRSNISHVGAMLSANWIRQTFSEFDPPREIYNADGQRRAGAEVAGRRFARGEQVYVEEHTLRHRYFFARRQNISLVSAVLSEIQQSLDEALRGGKERGGRRKAVIRHYFIISLAEFWQQMGRDPWAKGAFEFPQFSEHVLSYVGWPTSGLRATLRKALEDFSARS